MNILIAEDTPLLQLLNSELMKLWGYNFDLASNGAEAVAYAVVNEGKYDLCLMDIEMPIMNGLEAIRQIRRRTSYFPAMAYSSNAAYRQQCLESGFDEFVQKPVKPDNLLKKINELTLKSILLHTDSLPGKGKELSEVIDQAEQEQDPCQLQHYRTSRPE